MKNFPHQINQLSRLRCALAVFGSLIDQGENVSDDGVVGNALARAGVYTFRNPGTRTTEELLRSEHAKPAASQGTRACARDLRRFFILLGFVGETRDGWEVFANARSLLSLDEGRHTEQVCDIWRQALLNLELADDTGSSHPYQILLRLVAGMPGIAKPYSGLCLEARDDSDAELARIRRLAARDDPKTTMEELAGAPMARNSVKILPSIAEQLGDVIDRSSRLYISDRIADAIELVGHTEEARGGIAALVRRPFVPRRRTAGGQRREPGVSQPTLRIYDPDRIGNRINAHEDCLDRLSRLLPQSVEQFHSIYDLLLVGEETVLLIECKTIRNDARLQVRNALGQILYYEYFDVAPLHPEKRILRLLLTDAALPTALSRFLTDNQIGHVSIARTGEVGGTELGLANLRVLGATW